MRHTVAGLTLFLLVTSAWPGTWSDGFEGQNLDSWERAIEQAGTVLKIENGELSMEVHSGRISTLRVIGSEQWQDYTLTVRVKVLEIFGHFVDGGIFIHERSNFTIFYYFFVADGWELAVWQAVGEVPLPGTPPEGEGVLVYPRIGSFREGKSKVFTPELNRWYNLKVVTQGSQSEFYLDNDLVGAFDISQLVSGTVGLIVSNSLVHFDDFVVTGPGIPDGGPGGVVAVEPLGKLTTTWANIKQTMRQ